MARPSKAAIAARAAALVAAEEAGPEPFELPVPVIAAADQTPQGLVKVRVLPKGDGKVATGHFDREANKFTYHTRGDHLFLSPGLAQTQEDAGLVEIVRGS